jgi:hypothetical protein
MYSIDTSALIDAWHRDYRLSVFPSLWQRVAGLIDAGQLVASMTVRGELQRQEDELAEWADGNPGLFAEDDEEIQAGVRAILAGWPNIDFTRRLIGADLL